MAKVADAIDAYAALIALRKLLEVDGPIRDANVKTVMNTIAEDLTRLVGRSYPKGWNRWVPFTFPTYAQQRREDARERNAGNVKRPSRPSRSKR